MMKKIIGILIGIAAALGILIWIFSNRNTGSNYMEELRQLSSVTEKAFLS